MNPLSLSTLAQMCGATLLSGNSEASALAVSKDTRAIKAGDLYVALRGERFDGNHYIQEAAAKGAVAAICEGDAPVGLPAEFGVLSTPDALSALTLLASAWRSRLGLRSVVITGSSGKTSTKDFTASVLGSRFKTTATQGNLNNHIGLPLSILAANLEDEAAVWEIGMNHRGEISPLAGLARPEIGMITCIGSAHIEHLGSIKEIAREKGDLLERIPSRGCAVLPAHDEFIADLRARTDARVLEVGFHAGHLRATQVRSEGIGSRFVIEGDFGTAEATLPVPGKHMVGNALFAVAAGLLSGMPLADCAEALSRVRLTGGRLSLVERRGVTLLDDTYNANPDSMVAALETLGQMPTQGKRIAVLGKMGELGDHAAEGYGRVGKISAACVTSLICVGAEASAIAVAARDSGLEDVRIVADQKEAASMLTQLVRSGDLVLLKASRSARMEEVLNHFA
jgi:UDP-N-acetylmuramoyl-tripeptide--D-alanyl-D-alanine ligase